LTSLFKLLMQMERVFNVVVNNILEKQNGFFAWDSLSNSEVLVKLEVCSVQADLPAIAEVTPFKGFRAEKPCSRDMFSKSTGDGSDDRRDLARLRAQIDEIRNANSSEQKRLGILYGLNPHNLDTPLNDLSHFDLTRDFPADMLHFFDLGILKKFLVALTSDNLSLGQVEDLAMILDATTIWKEYKCRTSGESLKSVGSQIGRNLKALSQVLWNALYLLINLNIEGNRDLEVLLRTTFSLSKVAHML
jgi:hypothetical protein